MFVVTFPWYNYIKVINKPYGVVHKETHHSHTVANIIAALSNIIANIATTLQPHHSSIAANIVAASPPYHPHFSNIIIVD
jgi:hypothetical protein